jgi:hypothetical protein
VEDGVLRIEPDGFGEHPAFWADLVLTVGLRCTDEAKLLILYRWSKDARYAVRISHPFVTLQRQQPGAASAWGRGFAHGAAGVDVVLEAISQGGSGRVELVAVTTE